MEKEFSRVRSPRDLAISVVMIVAGVVAVLIPDMMALTIIGLCLVAVGLVLIFSVKSLRKDNATGVKYQFKSRYYAKSRKNELVGALKADPSKVDWSESGHEENFRVDIYYNKEKNQAFVKCFEFIPYEYIPASEWMEVSIDKSGNLVK